MSGSVSSGPSSPGTKWVSQSTRSASMNTRTSPRVTNSDFHIASPLPGWVPRSGRTSAARCTTAPASVATAYVASSESLSMTTISSRSDTVSTSASRTRLTTAPTVAASLRAGTTRLTVVPVLSLAATRSSRVHVHHACVRRANHAWLPAPREVDSTSRGYPATGQVPGSGQDGVQLDAVEPVRLGDGTVGDLAGVRVQAECERVVVLQRLLPALVGQRDG